MNRKVIILVILLMIFMIVHKSLIATPQSRDILYWNNNLYHVYPSININNSRFAKLEQFINNKYGTITSNWKGYSCKYEIINDTLYLISIIDMYNNNYMEYMFNSSDKKAITDFSGTIYLGYGNSFYDENMPTMVYESEITVIVENGVIKTFKDNRQKSKSSIYTSSEILNDFIYSHIQWDKLDSNILNKKPKVYLLFNVDSLGMIFDVSLLKSSGYDAFDKEALKIISKIPNYSVLFVCGKYVNITYKISIIFDIKKKKTNQNIIN